MLVSVLSAKIQALKELLGTHSYAKRSLATLADKIGSTESATEAIIVEHFGADAVRSIGERTGKVYYNLVVRE